MISLVYTEHGHNFCHFFFRRNLLPPNKISHRVEMTTQICKV